MSTLTDKLSLKEVATLLKKKPTLVKSLSGYVKKKEELKAFADSPSEGLNYAVENGYPFLATYYLSQGANPEYYTYNGTTKTKTFLEKALADNNQEMLKVLIEHQTAEERKNTLYGLRELLNTIDYNNLKDLEILLSAGIYPDQQSTDRRIPLHSASYLGNEGAVNLLLKYNASVDLADGNGVTPLMLATGKENIAVVKKLLEAGANPDYIDDKDLSALDMANMIKNPELIELISSYSSVKKLPKTKTTRKRSPKTVKRVTKK